MSGPEFFQTRMGRTFYEGTMPRLAESLQDLAKQLKEYNANATAEVPEGLLHQLTTDTLRACVEYLGELAQIGTAANDPRALGFVYARECLVAEMRRRGEVADG